MVILSMNIILVCMSSLSMSLEWHCWIMDPFHWSNVSTFRDNAIFEFNSLCNVVSRIQLVSIEYKRKCLMQLQQSWPRVMTASGGRVSSLDVFSVSVLSFYFTLSVFSYITLHLVCLSCDLPGEWPLTTRVRAWRPVIITHYIHRNQLTNRPTDQPTGAIVVCYTKEWGARHSFIREWTREDTLSESGRVYHHTNLSAERSPHNIEPYFSYIGIHHLSQIGMKRSQCLLCCRSFHERSGSLFGFVYSCL